jgi:hypothetical protein
MKLSAMELNLIVATLNESLRVKGRDLWSFDEQQRDNMKRKIERFLNETKFEINVEEENKNIGD